MYQLMAQRRAVLAGLLICLIVLAGCSGNAEPDAIDSADIEARVAAAVESTVVVAVEQTVTALGSTSATSAGSGGEVAVAPADSAAVEAPAEEIAAAPADNSQAITSYLLANGRHFVGNPNADVVVIEFSDFQ